MNVAISGARELPIDDTRFRAGLETALRSLGSGEALVVRSALARGADQVASEAALSMGGRLVALLPAPRGAYRERIDLDSNESGPVDRFDRLLERAVTTHELASVAPATNDGWDDRYLRLGHALLGGVPDGPPELRSPADVLLAVCDITRTDGGRGGTEDVVALAVDRGIRVVLVDPASGAVHHNEGLAEDVRAADAVLRPEFGLAEPVATGAKSDFVRVAYVLAGLSILAVLVGAMPDALATPAPTEVALAFALAELAMIFGAIVLVVRHRRSGRRDKWVDSRTSVELLRRERFLCIGRAGAYVGEGARASDRETRIASLRQLVAGPPSESGERKDLITAVCERATRSVSAGGQSQPEPVLVAWYRRARLEEQKEYFVHQCAHRTHEGHRWHAIARGAVAASVVGVLLHIAVLIYEWRATDADASAPPGSEQCVAPCVAGHQGHGGLTELLGRLGVLLAIGGPAAAAAAQMVSTMRNDSVDARRFATTVKILEALQKVPAEPNFDVGLWIQQVEALLLGEHLAWRAEMLSRDLDVG